MKKIGLKSKFKNAALIVAIVVIYSTPVLSFAKEVEKGSQIRYYKIGINTPIIKQKLHLSQDQPDKKRMIREFVLFSYDHVADDIINGKGVYFETLFSLLEIKTEEKADSLKDILKILMENERIPDFSNSIAAYYVNRGRLR